MIILLSSILLMFSNIHQTASKVISKEECINLRDVFGNASAEFTLCAVENSRPIKICQNCVNYYIDVVRSYKNMSELSVNSTTCLDVFVNQDRLQILNTLYSNSIDLWSRAKCYDCYLMKNGTQSFNKSDTFNHFQDLYKIFQECVNKATQEELCPYCMKDYTTLSNYYTKISDVNEKISYCIDMVDIMNNTWTFWSINCCKYRRHNEYMFIGVSIAVLIITVAFYFVLQFCGEKNAPLIIRQTRFAESINTLRNEIEHLST